MSFPRTAARLRRLLRVLLTIVCFALLGAAVFVVGAFISALGSVPLGNWEALIHVAALFAIFGALYGTILALDRSADPLPFARKLLRTCDAPLLRTAVCAAIGTCAVLFVWTWNPNSFAPGWAVLGAVAGAVLGWFGWRWAKYVDF